MGARELVILFLGLAIVVVVLTGLYAAVNARRGQIKLAADKNISNDLDADALELAELPGGGARIVDCSSGQPNLQNSALDRAESKSKTLQLADDANDESYIPVLMDAVALSEEVEAEAVFANDEEQNNEDPDSILLDYNEDDYAEDEDDHDKDDHDKDRQEQDDHQALNPLSAVTPDYVDETNTEADSLTEELSEPLEGEVANDHCSVSNQDGGQEDEEYAGDKEESEQELSDPANTIDEFSMTAGERIGDNAATIEKARQPDEGEQAVVNKPKKRRSLFSLFRPKSIEKKTGIAIKPEIESRHTAVETAVAKKEIAEEILPRQQAQNEEQNEVPDESIVDELEELRAAPAAAVSDELQSRPAPATSEYSEILVINITARQGQVFTGDDLLHILVTAGLKFGNMNIFHKRLSKDSQSTVIFSVANMLNPGTFDLNNMEKFTTRGISFFLALPTAIHNLDAFEQMLGIAQGIRETLDGELKDDHRNGMTGQTIEHYRQRIRDFELRRLKAVAARG